MKVVSVVSIIFAVAFLCATIDLEAQSFWQSTATIPAGDIYALLIDTNGTIYAGSYGGGIFLSTDGGSTWSMADSGLSNTDIQTLIVDPTTAYMFAGTDGGGIYRSTDKGSTWSLVGLAGKSVHAFAINSSGYIFAGIGTSGPDSGGVYRSTDHVESWQASSSGLTVSMVRSLLVASNGDLLAGTGGDGVYRSTDAGASWTQTGLPGLSVMAIALNGSGDVFAGTYLDGVYQSTNNGATWDVHHSFGESGISMVVSINGVIYVGTYHDGVYQSPTVGECWTQVGLSDQTVRAFALDVNKILYASTDVGVYRTSTTIIPAFYIDRCSMAFDTVLIPHSDSQSFVVRNPNSTAISISSISISDTAYSVVPSTVTVPAGDSVQFTVSFVPKVEGSHPAVVTITSASTTFPEYIYLSGWASTRILSLAKSLSTTVKLTLATDFLYTGGIDSAKITANIYNLGNDTLHLTSLTFSDSAFTIRPSTNIVPPDSYIVHTIIFRPRHSDSTIASLIITSDAPTSPDTFTVSGLAKTRYLKVLADSISNTKQRIDMGSVVVGEYKDSVVSIANIGNDTITVSSINRGNSSSTDTLFSARPKAFVIPPGSIFMDTIRYTPISDTSTTGILVIVSSAFVGKDTLLISGSGKSSEGVNAEKSLPDRYVLHQNFPNPFNPTTTIQFSLPQASYVSLRILNMLGQQVEEPIARELPPGQYSYQWNAANLPSGVYFCTIRAGLFTDTKKLILAK